MSGTGLTFTGVIGCGGAQFPTSALYRSSATDNASGVSRTLAAPAGIKAGELMVACVEAGAYVSGAGPYTFTADPAWTAIYEDPSSGASYQIIANLYAKTADAADEAGTSSYTWSVTVGGSQLAGMALAIVGWERQYGTTISSPAVSYGMDYSGGSVASPGGDWQLAYVTQRTAEAFVEPIPTPSITSPATELVPLFGGYRSGAMRVYASNNESPIVPAYTAGFDFSREALVVAAISL